MEEFSVDIVNGNLNMPVDFTKIINDNQINNLKKQIPDINKINNEVKYDDNVTAKYNINKQCSNTLTASTQITGSSLINTNLYAVNNTIANIETSHMIASTVFTDDLHVYIC